MNQAPILTPPPSLHPRINGAKVLGVRPGSPVFFKIAASGRKPLRYTVDSLPEQVHLDPTTGILTGRIDTPGTHRIQVTVSNSIGSNTREIRIVVGEQICLTPPMGWNSWYCWSESVDDAKIRSVAQAMVDRGLVDHGWSYVNIDDCWQGVRGGQYHAIQGNEKFPDFKSLGDYIHSLGLRFGIYSTCWMASYAGHIGGSSPNVQGDYTPYALPKDKRLSPTQFFGRYPGSIERDMAQIGEHWLVDRDCKQFADWGVDYLKCDWFNWQLKDGKELSRGPKKVQTLQRLLNDLRAVNRDIVLSLSPDSMIENARNLSQFSNLWRVTGDIKDEWLCLLECMELAAWYQHTRPGAYSDPDMLQIGHFGIPNKLNRELRPTKLTFDEQYTQVSLWALVSAPLLLSCDIQNMDDFTLGLITNDEVIDINQDPLCQAAKRVSSNNGLDIWRKPLEDGRIAVGLFNCTDKSAPISATWDDLQLTGRQTVRDAWRQQELGSFEKVVTCNVNTHGCSLLTVG